MNETCRECGVEAGTWFTDNDIWNMLDAPGILCPNCFMRLIDARGFATTGWKLQPEERVNELQGIVAGLTDVVQGKVRPLSEIQARLKHYATRPPSAS